MVAQLISGNEISKEVNEKVSQQVGRDLIELFLND